MLDIFLYSNYKKYNREKILEKILEKYNIKIDDFFYNKNGKPMLKHSMYISISHTKNVLLITVSNFKIGADIEENREYPFYKKISKYFHFDTNKKDFIKKWTVHEAYVKNQNLSLFSNKLIYDNCYNIIIKGFCIGISCCEKKYNIYEINIDNKCIMFQRL